MSPIRYPPTREPADVAVGAGRGQSLVEFALVFPFFIVILFGVIEFAFALNAVLSIDFAIARGGPDRRRGRQRRATPTARSSARSSDSIAAPADERPDHRGPDLQVRQPTATRSAR